MVVMVVLVCAERVGHANGRRHFANVLSLSRRGWQFFLSVAQLAAIIKNGYLVAFSSLSFLANFLSLLDFFPVRVCVCVCRRLVSNCCFVEPSWNSYFI